MLSSHYKLLAKAILLRFYLVQTLSISLMRQTIRKIISNRIIIIIGQPCIESKINQCMVDNIHLTWMKWWLYLEIMVWIISILLCFRITLFLFHIKRIYINNIINKILLRGLKFNMLCCMDGLNLVFWWYQVAWTLQHFHQLNSSFYINNSIHNYIKVHILMQVTVLKIIFIKTTSALQTDRLLFVLETMDLVVSKGPSLKDKIIHQIIQTLLSHKLINLLTI